MRILAVLFLLISTGTASADPGHLAEALGHNHWIGAIAIGAAVAVGVWGALKGKERGNGSDAPAEGHETEPQPEA